MATEAITATHARRALFRLMDRTQRLRRRYLLTREGRPQSVLMSAEEFEEWMETLDVLQDRALVRSIARGLADVRAGRVKKFEEVVARAARAPR